jgi:predicted nucleotidyltransferase
VEQALNLNLPLCRQLASEHAYPLLFATISGAHLYGFASPDSDYDLRGCHILPAREVLGLHAPKETIEKAGIRDGVEIDLVTHDAAKFFRLLLKKNGYVLEQLLSPLIVQTSPEHQELVALAPRCITKYHAYHYLGFADTQWGLFAKESPPRVKPLLYVYRVLLTGIHLMRTGIIEPNLPRLNEEYKLPYIGELIRAKTGGREKGTLDQADLAFLRAEYERLVARLEEEHQKSTLPEQNSAMSELSDLLVRLRS